MSAFSSAGLEQNVRTIPERHKPVVELIALMEQSDEPWRYEDYILWRATELEDPHAKEWVLGRVQGHG